MRSLCKHEVSAACLAVKSPQACIDDLTEQELQAQTAAAAPGRPHPAAIAVPVVAAGEPLHAAVFAVLTLQLMSMLRCLCGFSSHAWQATGLLTLCLVLMVLQLK